MSDTLRRTTSRSPATTAPDEPPAPPAPHEPPARSEQSAGRVGGVLRGLVLALGALLFLFPFYYMIVGSLQAEPDTSPSGVIPHSALTLHNYQQINSRVDLGRSLVNSGIFTAGVILCTVVFGLLAG